jgi:hypothetical protein
VNLHDAINRHQGLILQIGLLRQSLTDSERSWKDYMFVGVPNPIAESIRRQIVEKEAMLEQDVPLALKQLQMP